MLRYISYTIRLKNALQVPDYKQNKQEYINPSLKSDGFFIYREFMKAVIQRVRRAKLEINTATYSEIGNGVVILLGIEEADETNDIEWLANKIINLRIFNDDEGVMNKSLLDIGGDILLVSQFTLHASTKKGNRPSYIKAAKPDIAIPIYEAMIAQLGQLLGKPVKTGKFGADMQVSLTNDGPVTIIIDTKNKE